MWAASAAEGPGRSPGEGLWRRRLDQPRQRSNRVFSSLSLQHELYIRAYHMLSDFPPVSLRLHFISERKRPSSWVTRERPAAVFVSKPTVVAVFSD